MSIEDRLLADIAWREDELVNLKASYAQSAEHTPKGRSFRRAYLAMLYAHYEGFSKYAWEEYLIEISRCRMPLSRLHSSVASIFLSNEIATLKNCPSSDFTDGLALFRGRLLDVVSASYRKIETSNLWPNVLAQVLDDLRIDRGFVDLHQTELKSLVARRNDIAHGAKVGISDASIISLDHAVWEVFSFLTINIVDACSRRTYLK